MLHLYNEKPISIFTIESDVKIRVQFCNVKMKMKPCQFKHFHKYLTNLSKKIDGSIFNFFKSFFAVMQRCSNSYVQKIWFKINLSKLIIGVIRK